MHDPGGFYETRPPWGGTEYIPADRLTDGCFDIAWFWRLNPFDVMALTEQDLLLLQEQAVRIMANLKRD